MKKKQSTKLTHLKSEKWLWGLLFCLAIVIGFLGNFTLKLINNTNDEINPLEEIGVYKSVSSLNPFSFSFLSIQPTSRLTGKPFNKTSNNGQVVSVVIENYSPIRQQQTGLAEASIVYEAPVEGGISRFLALYDEEVSSVGPVRSARPYFISWASEYRAAFVHVGGSAAAIDNLKNNFRVFNLDEIQGAQSIQRSSTYLAPHNAYADIKAVLKEIKGKFNKPFKQNRFPFKEPDSTSGKIHNISLDYSNAPYKVKYVFDTQSKNYQRYNGGKAHGTIMTDNIVIQYVDQKVLDDEGRLRLQTQGTGKALVFRDGKVIEGNWQKDGSINSENQPLKQSFTKFFDKNGKEIPLNKGKTWIQVVPDKTVVNYF